jgi:hypothetical protein
LAFMEGCRFLGPFLFGGGYWPVSDLSGLI